MKTYYIKYRDQVLRLPGSYPEKYVSTIALSLWGNYMLVDDEQPIEDESLLDVYICEKSDKKYGFIVRKRNEEGTISGVVKYLAVMDYHVDVMEHLNLRLYQANLPNQDYSNFVITPKQAQEIINVTLRERLDAYIYNVKQSPRSFTNDEIQEFLNEMEAKYNVKGRLL